MAGLSPPRSKDPLFARKGLLHQPGTVLLGAAAIAFTGYVLGYIPRIDIPQIDGMLSRAGRTGHPHGLSIGAPVLLGLLGLLSVFLLLLLLRTIAGYLPWSYKDSRLFGRRAVSIETFSQSAGTHGISSRVAQETYRALEQHYLGEMDIRPEDHLWRQVRLTGESIRLIQSQLLDRCDRQEILFFSASNLRTVLDLMRHIEGAAPQSDGGGDGPGRREGDQIPGETEERRVPPEDGGLRGAPIPGRRRSDYTGVRRRTGDQPAAVPGLLPEEVLTADPLPGAKPTLVPPRNRSSDFAPRRRGDLLPKDSQDPRD